MALRTMNMELYQELLRTGSSEERAREAATANEITALEKDVYLLKWITGATFAFTVATLWLVINIYINTKGVN